MPILFEGMLSSRSMPASSMVAIAVVMLVFIVNISDKRFCSSHVKRSSNVEFKYICSGMRLYPYVSVSSYIHLKFSCILNNCKNKGSDLDFDALAEQVSLLGRLSLSLILIFSLSMI